MPVFTGLPFDVLTAIWDWLPFYTLIRLMGVNRLCRDVTMAHPYYWRILDLDSTRLSGAALEDATHLFFLRLERAESRPVIITLHGPDPRILLRRIVPHLTHVARLPTARSLRGYKGRRTRAVGTGPLILLLLYTSLPPLLKAIERGSVDVRRSGIGILTHVATLALVGVDQSYGQELIDMLDVPAPVMDVLVLKFGATGAPSFPLIGQRLFDSSAPCLRRVVLNNIYLPTPLPAVFNNLSSLLFHIGSKSVQQLPYGLGSRLSKLIVAGNVGFAPEYFHSRVWQRVGELHVFCPGAPPASLFPWHAWREVPVLCTSGASVESCLMAIDHFPGPLLLKAGISSCLKKAVFDFVRDPTGKTIGPRLRRLACAVPTSHADPNILRNSAAYLAIILRASWIVKFELRPVDWDQIVSHVTCLPSLGLLRILLSDGDSLSACSEVLETPKLQWLFLDVDCRKRLTRAIPASDLRSFLDGPLRHAPPSRRIKYRPQVTVVPSEEAQALSMAAHH